ncbi:MAG: phosphoribosyltransferase [Armatimonadota bacterium]
MSSFAGSSVVFRDREEAGQRLAALLESYRGSDPVVHALPRGGVVVGAEVARALGAPLELVIARKVGHPQSPEYAICAVSISGRLVCNEAERGAVDPEWLEMAVERERREAARRQAVYLEGRAPISAEGRTAVVVDDGIATGLTMKAAIEEIRGQRPRQLVVAVPVIPRETAAELRRQADAVVAVEMPALFLGAVGAYYVDFEQVSDEEVIRLLRRG